MTDTTEQPPGRIPPPSTHQLAFMIWLCVFPTLTADQPGIRGLAPADVARGSHLRARDHRRADRDLRIDAVRTQAPRAADDEEATALAPVRQATDQPGDV